MFDADCVFTLGTTDGNESVRVLEWAPKLLVELGVGEGGLLAILVRSRNNSWASAAMKIVDLYRLQYSSTII